MGTRSRFVRPDTKRLPLSDGDWIEVRKRLSAGDQRKASGRLIKSASINTNNGDQADDAKPVVEFDASQMGLSTVLSYLVDWSLPEFPIRGQSLDAVADALDALDEDDFNEIQAAVVAHQKAMKAERDQEKKDRVGENTSSAPLASLSA